MAERTGLLAIVDELGAGDAAFESADQLAMELGLDLPADRRGRGRPPGRRNLRNQRVADFVLSQVGDPLIAMARMAAMPVGDLAVMLKCSVAEAFAEKRLCAQAILPYLHQRQAIAVDLTTRAPVYLTMVLGDEAGVTVATSQVVDVVEYQGVNDGGERDV